MNWKVEKGDIDVEIGKFFRRYPLKGRIPDHTGSEDQRSRADILRWG